MRREGASWAGVSQALGVSVETLRRWWQDGSDEEQTPGALVPVAVSMPALGGELTLVTPGGLRVDGLDVASAALLIRALS
jgi:transposase-like protein